MNKPRGYPGLKGNPEESGDHQNANPRVLKVEISRGTLGFRVFEEPLAIPSTYQFESLYLLGV